MSLFNGEAWKLIGHSLRIRLPARRLVALHSAAALLALAAAGCGTVDTSPADGSSAATTPSVGGSVTSNGATPSVTADPSASGPVLDPSHALPAPGGFEGIHAGPDLLVHAQTALTAEQVAAIQALKRVTATEQFSLAQVAVQDRILKVAAVEPSGYRRFVPVPTAREQVVWDRLAQGELAVVQKVGERLQDDTGSLHLGNDAAATAVHIGAYAPQVPQIDAIVNTTYAATLGMPSGNAMLVSTGSAAPQAVRPLIEKIVGKDTSVQILGPNLDITVQQTAVLTGGSVAAAVGSFSYRVLGGGRIAPDPTWVSANIRTEVMPILGPVTCHRVLMPQLRAALAEIQARGLADRIHPDEYAGCYYPRFIANTTELSLHAFGIALDLNVPGNQRGTAGQIDRTVVSIFKKWGFTWGGDWRWTDPMHFEMNRVVEPR
ncbi:MAG: M15 family metallopeptidase [Nocardioides sp.]